MELISFGGKSFRPRVDSRPAGVVMAGSSQRERKRERERDREEDPGILNYTEKPSHANHD